MNEDLSTIGGNDEFEQLLERHMVPLRTYVRLQAGPLLRAREPLSDVVQSALREAWEARDTFRFTGDAAFRGFLYTIAAHKIISKNRYWAAQKRALEHEASQASLWDLPQSEGSTPSKSPSRHLIHEEDAERLREAFAALDPEDQKILSMRRIFDVPAVEIAKELGMAESTVRWRLGVIQTELASRLG
ncbi:MAG: sigma-70 family RNA polymerase sigma factor [Planctomycetes bacterium]|nr:sigma-70 family RNA polymerase sigma factor [Planctomycetota bacterium]